MIDLPSNPIPIHPKATMPHISQPESLNLDDLMDGLLEYLRLSDLFYFFMFFLSLIFSYDRSYTLLLTVWRFRVERKNILNSEGVKGLDCQSRLQLQSTSILHTLKVSNFGLNSQISRSEQVYFYFFVFNFFNFT
jgi:hypothetical protein